jgi:hypothetical protein
MPGQMKAPAPALEISRQPEARRANRCGMQRNVCGSGQRMGGLQRQGATCRTEKLPCGWRLLKDVAADQTRGTVTGAM